MKTPLRTQAQARQWMDEQGLSQAELARQFGVSTSLVDAILRGSKPCKRGASHNIAVYLGLKRGQAVAARQPYRARAVQAAGAGAAA
jgi:gp16 family phage-associated protein